MNSSATKTREFKSFIRVPGGGEISRCFYPFKLDTYGRGCCNNCHYCYARSVLHFRQLWSSDRPAVANYRRIKKVFNDVFIRKHTTDMSYLLNDRIPIRLGGMTDCFSDIEKERKVSLRTLKFLKGFDYPALILTKNKLIASPEYMEAMDPGLDYVQFSITTPYDDIAKLYEEGASTTSERLAAIETLTRNGFYVAARINPFFPIYPDGYYTGKRKYEGDPLRYFDWSLIDMLADAGCKTVIGGFLRLSTWNIGWIKEKTGNDLTYLFDPATKQRNSALHYGAAEKRYYYEKTRELCTTRGMEFSVCYDGDESYETFRDLWANPDDCCNGKGKIRGFKRAYDFENLNFKAKTHYRWGGPDAI